MKLIATYRLQLHANFTFRQATEVVPYLKELGISHIYCSPYLQARVGSTHGYDVVDHSMINRELGGRDGLETFVSALNENEMHHILDIVPNHMAIEAEENPWWWDVLENGPASYYAPFFDMEWNPPQAALRYRDKILLPVLGEHYGRVLQQGHFRVGRDGSNFHLSYLDKVYPLAPKSLHLILRHAAKGADHPLLHHLAQACRSLPDAISTDEENRKIRHEEKTRIVGLLSSLLRESRQAASAIDRTLIQFNEDCDALDELLACQNYRLAYWRVAEHDLGYRRFFDIGDLVGLRMENEVVFQKTHALICELVAANKIDGLRIDHPDGLRDPLAYFQRLREACPQAWIVVEKILQRGEHLRQEWPVAGTTGYDFIDLLNHLFVNAEGGEALTQTYAAFTGRNDDFADLVYSKKQQVLREVLDSDINRLAALLVSICEESRDHRDYTRVDLHDAIVQFVAVFPVYRTYVRYGDEVSPSDASSIETAVGEAQRRDPAIDPSLYRFLGDLMLQREPGLKARLFVERLQQFTGSAMAKGVEDTTFYCFNRLVSLNEVGSEPEPMGLSLAAFHNAQAARQETWPLAMLSTSTHDTKRSEDVRMRLNVLAEIPDAWDEAVNHWRNLNAPYKSDSQPDSNTEYLIYQSMVGAWPISCERLQNYILKACREAKEQTSWLNPDETFERSLQAFVAKIFVNRRFIESLTDLVGSISATGYVYSLAQTLIKLTSPGIPDIYQGHELWDFSLVDPDNRRPVDYQMRKKFLANLDGGCLSDIAGDQEFGLAKLYLIKHGLAVRRKFAECFGSAGDYRQLVGSGPKEDHIVAYRRGSNICVVCPRRIVNMDWQDTVVALPKGSWRNVLSTELHTGDIALQSLLSTFPVALLVRET